MKERNVKAREPPGACLYATATADPFFNESFKMPLPPPDKRRYDHMAPYRGYTIATYKDALDEPLYRVAKVPVYAVYFALDTFGDPITPVDTCFWSPFLAMAMIDIYVAMNENERKTWWKCQGAWPLIHQNYSSQHHLPMLLDTMRNIAAECADPDLDLLFGDAGEFGKHVEKRIRKGLDTIHLTPKPDEGEDAIFAKSE